MTDAIRHYRQHDVTPEDLERLRLSMEGYSEVTLRDIRCLFCGYLIERKGSDVRSGHKEVRCAKCKEVYVIDFRYFRTMRKRSRYKPFRLKLFRQPKERQQR